MCYFHQRLSFHEKITSVVPAECEIVMHVSPGALRPSSRNNNKSAQSNLGRGRGPRRGPVAHVRRKVPIGYNGEPQMCSQVPLPVDRSPNPTTCLIPGPVRPTMPNGIHIRSAVFPQCTEQTDRQTDRPTDRPNNNKLNIYFLTVVEVWLM